MRIKAEDDVFGANRLALRSSVRSTDVVPPLSLSSSATGSTAALAAQQTCLALEGAPAGVPWHCTSSSVCRHAPESAPLVSSTKSGSTSPSAIAATNAASPAETAVSSCSVHVRLVLVQSGTILGADRGGCDLPVGALDLSCDSRMGTLERTILRMPLELTKRASRRRVEVVGTSAVEERGVARAAFDMRRAVASELLGAVAQRLLVFQPVA